ncbi:MAG TPA: hypothetical protein VIY52_26870 [Streptosporangiaceae bacterium]
MNITPIAQPARLGQPWVREIVPGVFRVGTTFLGSCPVTVFPGREVRSRPSSWPGRSRPGQVERPARLTGEKNLINPATARTDMHSAPSLPLTTVSVM